jgi:hypothetical protein
VRLYLLALFGSRLNIIVTQRYVRMIWFEVAEVLIRAKFVGSRSRQRYKSYNLYAWRGVIRTVATWRGWCEVRELAVISTSVLQDANLLWVVRRAQCNECVRSTFCFSLWCRPRRRRRRCRRRETHVRICLFSSSKRKKGRTQEQIYFRS